MSGEGRPPQRGGAVAAAAGPPKTNKIQTLYLKMLTLLGATLATQKALGSCADNLCGTKIQTYTAADKLGGRIEFPRGPTFHNIFVQSVFVFGALGWRG